MKMMPKNVTSSGINNIILLKSIKNDNQTESLL